MVVQTTRRVVQNKLLWHFDNLKENETSAEESGTRLPTVNQVEMAVHDATKIIVKSMREMVAERIAMLT